MMNNQKNMGILGKMLSAVALVLAFLLFKQHVAAQQPIEFRIAEDSGISATLVKFERTGGKLDRAIFDREAYQVTYRGTEIWIEPRGDK